MDPKRILVVHYSRTGTTRAIAEALRSELGCESEAIAESRSRAGWLGYVRSMFDSIFRRPAMLRPSTKDPSAFDLVIVGTPVWNASVSAPVRTYLWAHRRHIPAVAFFCTYGGTGSARAIRQMGEICGQAPIVTLALRADEVGHAGAVAKLRTFASVLVRTKPPRPSGPPIARPHLAGA